MYLAIHAHTEGQLDEQDASEIGPGQILVRTRMGFGGTPTQRAQ